MTNNIHNFKEAQRRAQSSGDNGDGGGTRRRLRQLETDMATLIERVRNIEENMATKADLLKLQNSLLKAMLLGLPAVLLVVIGALRLLITVL